MENRIYSLSKVRCTHPEGRHARVKDAVTVSGLVDMRRGYFDHQKIARAEEYRIYLVDLVVMLAYRLALPGPDGRPRGAAVPRESRPSTAALAHRILAFHRKTSVAFRTKIL